MGKGGYRHLGILDLNKVSDEEIKQQLKKELYKRRLKLIQSSKLHGKKIMAVNIWVVAGTEQEV